jgi:hypothetical protein
MPHLYRLLPWLRTRRPADEFRTGTTPRNPPLSQGEGRPLRLVPPSPAVMDTATVRLGDGFISARFPPMKRKV